MKVIRATCSIQEGSIGRAKIKQLESLISSTYHAHFGTDYKLVFFWASIPYEQSYIAGKLSNASTVAIPVPDNTPSDVRHPFMSEICAKWERITGCSKNEIILVSSDMTHFHQFQAAMFNRVGQQARSKAKRATLLKMLGGYLRKGYFNASVNM